MLYVKVFKIFFGLKSKGGGTIEALHKPPSETLLLYCVGNEQFIRFRLTTASGAHLLDDVEGSPTSVEIVAIDNVGCVVCERVIGRTQSTRPVCEVDVVAVRHVDRCH